MIRALALLCLCLATPALAVTTVMQPWSGSDGPYNVVSMDGNTIYQGADQGGGVYSGFMYFRRPVGVNFTVGATLYLEVDFKDTGGPGRIGCQYNAVGNDFLSAGMVLQTSVQNTGGYKTGVIRLDANNFHLGQNGGNDLRLTHTQNLRFHIKEVRVSDTPGAAYLAAIAFMGPYTGPTYVGGTPVDSSSFLNKMYVGYQGWFRTPSPADADDTGWQHWTRSWGNMAAGLISEDFWPQMDEFTAAERQPATGYSYPGGAQAELFSSNNARTVLRHFQWMEAYGIDGAAVQRFTNGLASPGADGYRVISHVRAAANQTGRVYYIEYDMTGTPENELVANIANDWHTLVDSLQLQNDGRYLKHGGLPVVGVFGFFPERFSPATANAIIDIFQNGPLQYRAWVAGAGAWYWRTAVETTPAWQTMLYRLGAWQPWNCGNLMGTYPNQYAKYDYWAADKADFNARGIIYQPELFPGASSANRDGLPPSTPDMPRQGGKFLWDQFVRAHELGFQTVFLGMFDELDEGTQIIKVTENWPVEGSFKAYEGQPSDCYLCYAGLGAKMLKGQMAFTATKPDCPAQTQPSIPDAVSPLNGAVTGGTGAFSWSAALALPGGGTLTRYEVWIDGTVTNVGLVTSANLALAPGNHVWRVRAVNSLGVAGGWSVGQSFSSSGGPTATRTTTPAPPATPTPTASPSPTRTAVPVGGCGIQAEDYVAYFDQTAGNTGGQYRTDDVDIETTGDAGGGYNVGWTDGGEWLEYLLNVPSTGSYDLTLRVASGGAEAGTVQLSVDGAALGPQLNLPETGGWQSYQDLTLNAQTLAGGIRRLRVANIAGGFNFNYLCVRPAATPTPTATGTRTATRSATASLSPTRTATASVTRTGSPSSTRTATLSPTRSATASAIPSGTASMTASPSRTASGSPSSSPSRTASGSPSSSPSRTASTSPTRTVTASVTSSPSGTVSSSPSSTRTATVLASATATPTPSPVFTQSATVTGTRTFTVQSSVTTTPTASPVNTQSATVTGTRTSSAQPSVTTTPTASLVISATPSASGTETVLASVTGSPTASPVLTQTVSLTGTRTATAQDTGTASPTPSPVITATASVTSTRSPTAQDTATASPTASPLITPTASLTGTRTPTVSISLTASPSPSPTVSRTASPSASPTPGSTRSPTLTASVTVSLTLSPSATPTRTSSPVPTASPSRTLTSPSSPVATASVTPSPAQTVTGTQTPALTPTLSASPQASAVPDASPRILQVRPFPNPNPRWLSVELEGNAVQVRVRLYSPARVAVLELSVPANGAGWLRVPLPLNELSAGLWHYQVDLGPGDPAPKLGSFLILR